MQTPKCRAVSVVDKKERVEAHRFAKNLDKRFSCWSQVLGELSGGRAPWLGGNGIGVSHEMEKIDPMAQFAPFFSRWR